MTTGLIDLTSGAALGSNLPNIAQAAYSNVRDDDMKKLARMTREKPAEAKDTSPACGAPGSCRRLPPVIIPR